MSAINAQTSPIPSTPASLGIASAAPAQQQARTGSAGNASVQTGFDPTPVAGGGPVTDFIKDAVGRMVNMAAQGKEKLEQQMAADTASNGGKLDAATVQRYTSQLNTFDSLSALAKKLQESKDNSIQIWLR